MAIDNDLQRLTRCLELAHIHLRIVGQHGADAGQHDTGTRTPALDIGTRRRSGNPFRFAIQQGGLAIQRSGRLQSDPGSSARHAGNETDIEFARFAFQQAGLHLDPGQRKQLQAAPGHLRVRVAHRGDHACDAGIDQRVGAGRCAAMMAARLQRDIGGGALCPRAGGTQGVHFGVRPARFFVPACTYNHAITHNHAADAWIWRRREQSVIGQAQGARHVAMVFGAETQGFSTSRIASRKSSMS